MTTKKCGDCIHADICKQLNGGWFSRENIAYCKGFKDRTSYVEVVRCKDCKGMNEDKFCVAWEGFVREDDFCSYGERKDNG